MANNKDPRKISEEDLRSMIDSFYTDPHDRFLIPISHAMKDLFNKHTKSMSQVPYREQEEGFEMMKYRVLLKRNADGVEAYTPWQPCSYGEHSSISWWTDGNMSCDCNRDSYFNDDLGEGQCGETEYSIVKIECDADLTARLEDSVWLTKDGEIYRSPEWLATMNKISKGPRNNNGKDK